MHSNNSEPLSRLLRLSENEEQLRKHKDKTSNTLSVPKNKPPRERAFFRYFEVNTCDLQSIVDAINAFPRLDAIRYIHKMGERTGIYAKVKSSEEVLIKLKFSNVKIVKVR